MPRVGVKWVIPSFKIHSLLSILLKPRSLMKCQKSVLLTGRNIFSWDLTWYPWQWHYRKYSTLSFITSNSNSCSSQMTDLTDINMCLLPSPHWLTFHGLDASIIVSLVIHIYDTIYSLIALFCFVCQLCKPLCSWFSCFGMESLFILALFDWILFCFVPVDVICETALHSREDGTCGHRNRT